MKRREITAPCDSCGIRLSSDDWYDFIDGDLICYDCLKANYRKCDCDSWIHEDEICEICNND